MSILWPLNSSARTCRRFPLLILTWLLVSAPGARAASYRAAPAAPSRGDAPHRPHHQPSLSQYYHPGAARGPDRPLSPPGGVEHPDSGSRSRREWPRDGDSRLPGQEADGKGFGPEDAGDAGPLVFGKWTSRNTVRKTKALAYLGPASHPPYDRGEGLQGATGPYQDGFRAMPPFQPPPSSSQLPDLSHPLFLNFSSPFGPSGQRPTRTESNTKRMKRDSKTADSPLGGYGEEGGKAAQPRPDWRAWPWAMPPFRPPPSVPLLPDPVHLTNSRFAGPGRSRSWAPEFRFPEPPEDFAEMTSRANDRAGHAAAARRDQGKRAAERADLFPGGYHRDGPRARQAPGRGAGDVGKRYRDGQGQEFHAMPPFQPPPSSSLLPDLFTPPVFANDSRLHPAGPRHGVVIGQRPTRPSATGARLLEPPGDPSGPFGQDSSGQLTDQSAASAPDLPATAQEDPNAQQQQTHPRDVVVKIDTPRLQLTYRAIAPPYFTFEGLLSQMATYLIPGFCVDLAVTRRDDRCDIVSHMAALRTDREQNWLIEVVDSGGKIIWLNQCMPDSRLFIVPGLRVYFRYGAHGPSPGPALPVSTGVGATSGASPAAGPGSTRPAGGGGGEGEGGGGGGGTEETSQPGLPAPDSGWVPHGQPPAPRRQTPETSPEVPQTDNQPT